MEAVTAFTLEIRPDNIAVITIDAPGEKINTLKAEFGGEVRTIIRQLREKRRCAAPYLSPLNPITLSPARIST